MVYTEDTHTTPPPLPFCQFKVDSGRIRGEKNGYTATVHGHRKREGIGMGSMSRETTWIKEGKIVILKLRMLAGPKIGYGCSGALRPDFGSRGNVLRHSSGPNKGPTSLGGGAKKPTPSNL